MNINILSNIFILLYDKNTGVLSFVYPAVMSLFQANNFQN